MFLLARFHARLFPPAQACLVVHLLVSLLLFVACKAQSYNGGALPSATAPPSLGLATSVPTTPTQAVSIQAPTEAPSIAPAEPAQAQAVTPPDQAPASTPGPTDPSGYVVNGTGNSNIEQAHLRLQSQDDPVYLVIVSSQSTGIEGEIYRDLRQRHFRTTTGPDEGVDTKGEFCYPNCVFVLSGEVNAISIDSWVRVLQHEYRHITQAKNNPSIAQDFRDPNGMFTPYAAFSEACADYGLNVAPVYHAQERIDRLKNVVGTDQQGLIDQACGGDKSAYQNLVDQYNQEVGQTFAFQELFPPYQ
jgi:hypothetical protein